MPKIRTVFRPWEEVEVDDAEAAALARHGVLSPIEPGELELDVASEPESLPAVAPAPPAKPRRGKTTDADAAAMEEVNTDGSSEESRQSEEG